MAGVFEHKRYLAPVIGQLTAAATQTATCSRLTSKECDYVMFKADAGNANAVTLCTVTNNTNGYPLAAGNETPWIPTANVNLYYGVFATTTDKLIYHTLSDG